MHFARKLDFILGREDTRLPMTGSGRHPRHSLINTKPVHLVFKIPHHMRSACLISLIALSALYCWQAEWEECAKDIQDSCGQPFKDWSHCSAAAYTMEQVYPTSTARPQRSPLSSVPWRGDTLYHWLSLCIGLGSALILLWSLLGAEDHGNHCDCGMS